MVDPEVYKEAGLDSDEWMMLDPEEPVPDPEQGPWTRRVGDYFEDALFSEEVDPVAMQWWFTEPEGGWPDTPERVRKARLTTSDYWRSFQHVDAAGRTPLALLREGDRVRGTVVAQLLYHGVQVDIGAEWDGIVPLGTLEDWGLAARPTAAQLRAQAALDERLGRVPRPGAVRPLMDALEEAAVAAAEALGSEALAAAEEAARRGAREFGEAEPLGLGAKAHGDADAAAAAAAEQQAAAAAEEEEEEEEEEEVAPLARLNERLPVGASFEFVVHRVRSRRFASGRQLFRFPVQLVPADAELAALLPDPDAWEPPMDLRTMPSDYLAELPKLGRQVTSVGEPAQLRTVAERLDAGEWGPVWRREVLQDKDLREELLAQYPGLDSYLLELEQAAADARARAADGAPPAETEGGEEEGWRPQPRGIDPAELAALQDWAGRL